MADIKNIIPNSAMIQTKIGAIEGFVIGVCVRGVDNRHIEYNVAHIINGERKSEWYYDFEIEQKFNNSKPMGFNKINQKQLVNGTR